MPNLEVTPLARITLPTGAQLQAFPDASMLSAECSATTNLQTQIAPFLASAVCQIGILNLLKPLIEIVKGLPNPPPRALVEFEKAAVDLAPCLFSSAAAAMVPFARDLICLQIRSLNCFVSNLESLITLIGNEPGSVGTSDIQNLLASYPPIAGIFDLAARVFGTAGIQMQRAPLLASDIDVASLSADREAGLLM